MAGSGEVTLSDLMERYVLTDDILKKECTREHSLEIGRTIDWRGVGQHLLTEVELSDIDIDGHSEPLKRSKMLTKWKQKCSFKATYKVLIEAMLKAGRMDQAEGVCALLSPLPPQQPSGAGTSQPTTAAATSQKDVKPSLNDMTAFKGKHKKFNIFERIGTHYTDFGTLLLVDELGEKIASIKEEHHSPKLINREIVRRWLVGESKEPKTWGTLVDTLEDIELTELAKEIKEALGF